MANINKRCSTPVNQDEITDLHLTLSAIQKTGRRNDHLDSIPTKKAVREREKNIQKNSKSEKIYDGDGDTMDHEFETVDIHEIFPREPENRKLYSEEDSSSNSTIPLFKSPSDKNRDDYEQRYLQSLEDIAPVVIPPCPNETPEREQPLFKDATKYTTYLKPWVRNKLSPSQISFSPKWENRIAAKYSSPSEIRSRKETLMSQDNSPGLEGLWGDLAEDMIPASTSSTFLGTKGSKLSHLCVKNHLLKRFTSPTRKFAVFDKENISQGRVVTGQISPEEWLGRYRSQNGNATSIRARDKDELKAETRIGRNKSSGIQNSRLAARKRVRFSPKYNSIDSVDQSEETLKENGESTEIGSPLSKQSKPTVVSVEIIEKPIIFKF